MPFGIVSDPLFLRHRQPGHPERPERLEAVLSRLGQEAWFQGLRRVPAREADTEELALVHSPEVMAKVRSLSEQGGGQIDPDTYVGPDSDFVARSAVGGGIDLAMEVLQGGLSAGFALVRPPGHHATPERSMGFCLFSNVAIVAKCLSERLDRIAIFDWDVHHGNGTQDCLYDHPKTCFISLHQSAFYPGTGELRERGSGPGEGLTYNVPLPWGCGDAEYLATYLQVVRPILRRYDPQFLLVSAGYDAHRRDPIGGMKVSTEGFRHLAGLVLEDAKATSAGGRLVGFLEGGYDAQALAESVHATLEVWKRKTPFPGELEPEISPEFTRFLLKVRREFQL